MPYYRYFSLLFCIVLWSCNTTPDTPDQPITDHELLAETTDTATEAAAEPVTAYTMPDSAALRHYAVDTTNLTPEPAGKIKILLEGLFHKEDVWRGAENKKWLGLFDNNGSYELRPTTLHITPAFDPVADARTEITTGRKIISGREVRGTEQSVLLFITGLALTKPGPVDTATFAQAILRPGQEQLVTFKNKPFRLQAFGDSTQLETGEYGYNNYGWKITCTKKGKKLEQVLAQDEMLQGTIYLLQWAGDLDRDGIPDLVAEVSNHYSHTRTALFLSSPAAKGQLYKQVAVFETSRR